MKPCSDLSSSFTNWYLHNGPEAWWLSSSLWFICFLILSKLNNRIRLYKPIRAWPCTSSFTYQVAGDIISFVRRVVISSLHYPYWCVHSSTQRTRTWHPVTDPLGVHQSEWDSTPDMIMSSGQKIIESYMRKSNDTSTMWLSRADRSSPVCTTRTRIHSWPT